MTPTYLTREVTSIHSVVYPVGTKVYLTKYKHAQSRYDIFTVDTTEFVTTTHLRVALDFVYNPPLVNLPEFKDCPTMKTGKLTADIVTHKATYPRGTETYVIIQPDGLYLLSADNHFINFYRTDGNTLLYKVSDLQAYLDPKVVFTLSLML